MHVQSMPPLNHEGLLPPFLGDPSQVVGLSPYKSNVVDLVTRFGISKRRLEILYGFIMFRRRLFQVGLKRGFQWINGSFVQILDREPNDIDVVTIFHSSLSRHNFKSMVAYYSSLFHSVLTKRNYETDAYFVDAAIYDYYNFSRMITYWFGLFSHTREGFIWKGIIEIPLPNSDKECDAELEYIVKAQEAYHGQ